jgi:phenylacetate-CoA ligase
VELCVDIGMIACERRDPEYEVVPRLLLDKDVPGRLEELVRTGTDVDVHGAILGPAGSCILHDRRRWPRLRGPVTATSIDELRALQLRRLRETFERVYERVPHYRHAFGLAGVRPGDLVSLDDLTRFPFTAKGDLRANYPFGMFAVPREDVARIHASSGTTGRPTVVGYTQQDVETWAELVARSMAAAGARRGDIVHVAYGYGLFTGGLGAHYGAERLGCTVVPVSGGMTERQVQLISDLAPRVIMVTPSYFLSIVDEMERVGLDPAGSSLEIGIFGAEPWTSEMRAEIEQRCRMHAVDIYGLSEVIGPGVAQESVETKDGLHIWEDHFYPEIVDPETGDVLPDGERGELVFTSLTKQAMPIVRYRTRDLTRLLPGTALAPHRRMERVAGRSDDMMIVRGVNVFPSQIEEQILRVDGLTPHYLCVLTRPGRLDALTVQVEALDTFAAGDAAARLARELVERVKQAVGVSIEVDVVAPGALERSQGKARRIDDRR